MNQYDHLKNKLHDYKVEIDKEKLWKNTSHAIPQRKRRLAIPVIMLAALAISAWLMYSASSLPVSEQLLTSTSFPVNEKPEFTENLEDRSPGNSNEIKESKPDPIKVISSKLTRSVSKLISSKNQSRPEYSSSPLTTRGNNFLNAPENENEFLETSLTGGQLKSYNSKVETNNIPKENTGASINTDALILLKGQYASIQNENDVRNTDRINNSPVDYIRNDISQIP